MKNTTYKKKQGERQVQLIEQGAEIFSGAMNRGLASWKEIDGRIKQAESRVVLRDEDREKNLYGPIREDVIQYVNKAHISWWHMAGESNKEVSAHTLSSQVCCFNHLFMIRNDEEAIKAILRNATGITFDEILPSFIEDNTLISFEFVFDNKRLLNERHETRGEKCTSVDALVYAQKDSEKWLVPIEWKYTEAYEKKDAPSYHRYENLVSVDSRLPLWLSLYHQDPYYELARQTLLMEKIIEKHPDIANKFCHIVIVPKENTEMKVDAEKFGFSLKQEFINGYKIIDPSDFLLPVKDLYPELIEYLESRYW